MNRQREIERRLQHYAKQFRCEPDEVVSIKFRPVRQGDDGKWHDGYTEGSAHQEMRRAIDSSAFKGPVPFAVEEHETGPEIFAALELVRPYAELVVAAWNAYATGLKKTNRVQGLRLEVRKLRKTKTTLQEKTLVLKAPVDHLTADEIIKVLREMKK